MKSSFIAAVALSSIFLSSCVLAIGTGHDGTEAFSDLDEADSQSMTSEEAVSENDDQDAAESKPKKEVDLAPLEFELMMAELDLRSTEASLARSMESALHAIALAERDLRLAQEDVEHHAAFDMTLAAAESKLSLDRTRGRLEDSKAELAQLVGMYKDEEFAESTKELVLTRGMRGVEQSERSLELAERRAADRLEFEITRKHAGLAHKVGEAERSLKLKVDALATAESDGKVKLLRAGNKLEKAKKKLDDAKTEAGE